MAFPLVHAGNSNGSGKQRKLAGILMICGKLDKFAFQAIVHGIFNGFHVRLRVDYQARRRICRTPPSHPLHDGNRGVREKRTRRLPFAKRSHGIQQSRCAQKSKLCRFYARPAFPAIGMSAGHREGLARRGHARVKPSHFQVLYNAAWPWPKAAQPGRTDQGQKAPKLSKALAVSAIRPYLWYWN